MNIWKRETDSRKKQLSEFLIDLKEKAKGQNGKARALGKSAKE